MRVAFVELLYVPYLKKVLSGSKKIILEIELPYDHPIRVFCRIRYLAGSNVEVSFTVAGTTYDAIFRYGYSQDSGTKVYKLVSTEQYRSN